MKSVLFVAFLYRGETEARSLDTFREMGEAAVLPAGRVAVGGGKQMWLQTTTFKNYCVR